MMLSLIRGAVDAGTGSEKPFGQLPLWLRALVVVALPWAICLALFVEYCAMHVYLVLAMVEDDKPPTDEPGSLGVSGYGGKGAAAVEPVPGDLKGPLPVGHGRRPLASSSHRSIYSLLSVHGGLQASFRGAACFLAVQLVVTLSQSAFAAAFGPPLACLGRLLARLALVQLDVAWVHIVMARSPPRLFFRRLPPFRRTLAASWKPVALEWLASVVVDGVPLVLAALVGVDARLPVLDAAALARCLVVVLGTVAAKLLAFPARVVRVRVQASLFPVDEQPVVALDRSLGAQAVPAAYVSMADAWATFSSAAWRRVLSLYIQALLANLYMWLALDIVKNAHVSVLG